MKGKYNKILFGIISLFLVIFVGTNVNAKEMTIDELAEIIKAVNPRISSLFVIGEHVYTSEHTLTTQDTMLAARTINVANGADEYEAMAILKYEPTYDENWKLKGLKYVSTEVGKASSTDRVNIRYIDYVNIDNLLIVDGLVEKAYETIDTTIDNDKFELDINGNDATVTIKDSKMNSVTALKGTGVSTAAQELLKTDGVKEVVITSDKLPGASVKVSDGNIDLGKLDEFFLALAGNGTAKDLAGKSITVEIMLEEGYTASGSTTFTVTFDSKEVVVSGLVEKAYETIDTTIDNDKFELDINGNDATVTIKDSKMNSVTALKGTGVSTAAQELLKTDGVKEVVITSDKLPGASVKVSDGNIDLGKLDEFFLALAGNGTAKDLAGKSITVTIELEEGYTASGSTTFTVTFDSKEVVVSGLVEDAYETIDNSLDKTKFELDVNGNDATVTINEEGKEMNSVLALKGTGVSTAAQELLKTDGVKEVVITSEHLPGAKVPVSDGNIDLGKLDEFFLALAGNGTAKDLAGKSITVTIELEEGYTASGSTTFTVSFN